MVTSQPSPWLESECFLEGSDLDRYKCFLPSCISRVSRHQDVVQAILRKMNAFKPRDHFYLDSKLFHFLLIRKFSTISRSYFSLWVLHCWVIPLSFRKGAQTFISRSSFQLIDLQSFCVFRLSRFWIIKAIALSDTFLIAVHIPSVVSSLSFKFFN